MAENPFTNFFSSVAAGHEVGRGRKTLLQRAQRGDISRDEVPSMGATILQGIGRAAMSPSQRLQQDQIKLQAASMAMQNEIRQDSAKLQQVKFVTEQAAEQRKIREEMEDAVLVRNDQDKIQKLAAAQDFDAIASFLPDSGLSEAGATTVRSLQENAMKSARAVKAQEFKDLAKEAAEMGVPVEGKTAAQLQREIDIRIGIPSSGIGQMVSDYNAAIARGDTNTANMILPSIQNQAVKSGSRLEIGSDGRVIFAEGGGVGPAPLTTATKGTLQKQVLTAKTLLGRMDELEQMVSVETTGVRGGLRDLMNIVGGAVSSLRGEESFEGFDENTAVTKQLMNQLTSDVMGYIRSDSGNMSNKDMTMLMRAVPEFKISEPVDVVKTKVARLKDLFLLKEFIARKELGTLDDILLERGPDALANSLKVGQRFGMENVARDAVIGKAIGALGDDTTRATEVLRTLVHRGVITLEEGVAQLDAAGLIDEGSG